VFNDRGTVAIEVLSQEELFQELFVFMKVHGMILMRMESTEVHVQIHLPRMQ
ncbi:unnamed protein product, partial [marine sediment metagenome]